MIDFENVTFAYPGGDPILKGINLCVSKGERIAIIGNNGSGKTTLALLIDGILKPTGGTISVDGLDPTETAESNKIKQKVGLVFQNPDNQLVSTTVEREIAFSLENINTPFDSMQRQVERMIEFFDLAKFRKRLTSDLSGGEKQRLALAAVMASGADILILDEPGSYLDESGKTLLNDAVGLLMEDKQDLTVVRITQYARIASNFGRIIVLHDGRVLCDGSPEEIFSRSEELISAGIDIPFEYKLKNRVFAGNSFKPSPSGRDTETESRKIGLINLTFGYDEKEILFNELNLTIADNYVYGLVGHSGSGKTTLIQLLAGLIKPVKGSVNYSGFDPDPGQLVVSFQQPERQFFLETVDREIRFGAENLGLDDIDSIADECYDKVGLDKARHAARNPFSLSGGEKRRLAFGSIISLKPAFIFFDEPTCGLDSDGINRFENLVVSLKKEGVGVVIVSHHGDIIFDMCDRIILLDRGKISGEYGHNEFFREIDHSGFLSIPEPISYQLDRFGEIRYFSRRELMDNI